MNNRIAVDLNVETFMDVFLGDNGARRDVDTEQRVFFLFVFFNKLPTQNPAFIFTISSNGL